MADQTQPTHSVLPSMPSLLDRELSDRTKDAFGHAQFADALRDLVETKIMNPPFSIGLLGPWGTGKSTIKELYLNDLKDDKSKTDGLSRSDRIFPITFNAWRHGGEEDLKRALLREAYLKLGGDESELDRELLHQVNKTVQVKRNWKDLTSEFLGQLFLPMLMFVVLFLSIFSFSFFILNWTNQISIETVLGFATGAFLLTAWISKNFVDMRVRAPAFTTPQTNISFPSRSAEEYEKLLKRQIFKFRKGRYASVGRLVIFVDDLDRLSAAEMVRGLDAIRNFLDLPLGAKGNPIGIVFVISCDEDRVAEALFSKRYRAGAEELPGTVFSKNDARRYLDRLFQFRLEIPPFPKQDMRQFARTKIEEDATLLAALKRKNVALDDVIDRLIHVGVQSPRNAIQLLNAFLQSWWIALRREENGRGSSAPGALDDGAVTGHPNSLAALTVLKVDFPDFYDAVCQRPEFLLEFRGVVFGRDDPNKMPIDSRLLMEPYLIKKDDALTNDMKQSYRALRQYLASLESLKWPERIQPLVRLAVDPISRQFGDGTAAIYNNLVSGNVSGVLDSLGRALDSNPLSTQETKLLQDLTERAMQDTETRRINTARVLSALVNRISDEHRRALLTPLIRQMTTSREVRYEAGPENALSIIDGARGVDRRETAAAFIADVLHGGEIEWRKPGGGTPNLDELTSVAKQTVSLAVEVWRTDDLPSTAKQVLSSWLLKREIKSGDNSITLPFTYLEAMIEEYGDTLLPTIGKDYTNQAIGALQAETEKLSDVSAILSRLTDQFSHFANSGQEDRENLWAFLTRLVGVRDTLAVDTAWREAGVHKDLASGSQAVAFLAAFADRLKKDLTDNDNWPCDWENGGAQFADLLNNWRKTLTSESAELLLPLITGWAATEACEPLAIRCLDTLKEAAKPEWDKAITMLSSSGINALPEATIKYIASNTAAFNDEHRAQFSKQLNAAVNGATPDIEAVQRYAAFVNSLPDTDWSSAPWNGHLNTAITRINQMHSDAAYLSAFLPIVASLLSFAAQGAPANMIKPLFENSAGAPDAYGAAHRAFTGHWPAITTQIGDYDPKALVSRGCQFIRENAKNALIGSVYISMLELLEKKIAPEDVYNELSAVTPIVWRTTPKALEENLATVALLIRPAHTANLMTGAQPKKFDANLLHKILGKIAADYDDGLKEETLYNTLQSQPVKIEDEPDGALALWKEALGVSFDTTAAALLKKNNLNDDQSVRLLSILPEEFWTSEGDSLLTGILSEHAKPKSQSHLSSSIPAIASEAKTASHKSKLVDSLIEALPSLPAASIATMCKAIATLGGESQLERASDTLKALDVEQISAVLSAFPTSRAIRRASAEIDVD